MLLQEVEGKRRDPSTNAKLYLLVTLLSTTLILSMCAIALSAAAYIQSAHAQSSVATHPREQVAFDPETEKWIMKDVRTFNI